MEYCQTWLQGSHPIFHPHTLRRPHVVVLHLVCSAVLVVASWQLLIAVWYPDFFFYIEGGLEGLLLLTAIQLVVGPLLTSVLFVPGKAGLAFDMTVVLALQAVCLAGGLTIMYSERPTFFVYYEKHFYSASADTFSDSRVSVPDYRDYSSTSPAVVYVKFPDDPIEEAGLRRVLYQDRMAPWTYAALYLPLNDDWARIYDGGETEAVMRTNDINSRLDPWLAEHGGTFEDYVFIPILSRYRPSFIGIRRAGGKMIGIVNIASQDVIRP